MVRDNIDSSIFTFWGNERCVIAHAPQKCGNQILKLIGIFPRDKILYADGRLFFEQFDPVMPGFAQMREDVEGLLAKGYVISTLEFESDSGDANSRQVEVDWLWHLSGEAQHRVVLKCTLVRKGKAWKITALSPSDFLRAP